MTAALSPVSVDQLTWSFLESNVTQSGHTQTDVQRAIESKIPTFFFLFCCCRCFCRLVVCTSRRLNVRSILRRTHTHTHTLVRRVNQRSAVNYWPPGHPASHRAATTHPAAAAAAAASSWRLRDATSFFETAAVGVSGTAAVDLADVMMMMTICCLLLR